mgnify:CR=1 FL=1
MSVAGRLDHPEIAAAEDLTELFLLASALCFTTPEFQLIGMAYATGAVASLRTDAECAAVHIGSEHHVSIIVKRGLGGGVVRISQPENRHLFGSAQSVYVSRETEYLARLAPDNASTVNLTDRHYLWPRFFDSGTTIDELAAYDVDLHKSHRIGKEIALIAHQLSSKLFVGTGADLSFKLFLAIPKQITIRIERYASAKVYALNHTTSFPEWV